MSSVSPLSPVEQRDFRSAAKPFKRARDTSEKWSNGMRPSAGVSISIMNAQSIAGVPLNYSTDAFAVDDPEGLMGGSSSQREKIRPKKQGSQMSKGDKSHANKTPKPTGHPEHDMGFASGRMVRKMSALVDANDHTTSPLSQSLLELLPTHANNTNAAIQTAILEKDAGVLYSYDNKVASPTAKGRAVGLDALVDQAEKKWIAEQTDKIVKGEYEVLDAEGEITVLAGKKGKKGSPKQRAVKNMPAVVKDVNLEEDDGFELV